MTTQIINNEGKKIEVTNECYNDLKTLLSQGYWSTIINDTKGNIHCVLLSQFV